MTYDILPHLDKCVPSSVSPDKLSMYTIALEGWRRGLPLKFYITKYGSRLEINYSFEYEGKEYKFAVSKGEDVTKEAMRIAKNKFLTKEYLSKKNVSVPEGNKFDKSVEDETILDYADKLGYPVVLKPSNANLGQGVIPKIQNRNELYESLQQVRHIQGFYDVIVEKHVEGEEVRIYVLDGKVIAAMKRIPAYIIGDGKHTIRQLIRIKNSERRKNPNYKGRNIKIDKELRKNVEKEGYTLETILEEGKKLYLRKNSNISSGGESIDVTDELTKEMKKLAIDATKAIPGLVQSGVDVIINKNNNTGAVIEVNTRPGIGGHLYPSKGKARDIPKAIIDYYFPNTKRREKSTFFYFDYSSIKEALNSGLAEEIIVPSLPSSKVIIKTFKLEGDLNSLSLKRWIQRKALSYNLYGFIKPNSKQTGTIVLAGLKEDIETFVEKLKREKNITISASNSEWQEPIKVGFEIKKMQSEKNVNEKPVKVNLSQPKKKNLTFRQKIYKRYGHTTIWKIYKKFKKG